MESGVFCFSSLGWGTFPELVSPSPGYQAWSKLCLIETACPSACRLSRSLPPTSPALWEEEPALAPSMDEETEAQRHEGAMLGAWVLLARPLFLELPICSPTSGGIWCG